VKNIFLNVDASRLAAGYRVASPRALRKKEGKRGFYKSFRTAICDANGCMLYALRPCSANDHALRKRKATIAIVGELNAA
jgi:hypothetical protein